MEPRPAPDASLRGAGDEVALVPSFTASSEAAIPHLGLEVEKQALEPSGDREASSVCPPGEAEAEALGPQAGVEGTGRTDVSWDMGLQGEVADFQPIAHLMVLPFPLPPSLQINFVFLFNIVRILMTKLRASTTSETIQYR